MQIDDFFHTKRGQNGQFVFLLVSKKFCGSKDKAFQQIVLKQLDFHMQVQLFRPYTHTYPYKIDHGVNLHELSNFFFHMIPKSQATIEIIS